jgi:DNA-binding NarL/FixJ family response regulator
MGGDGYIMKEEDPGEIIHAVRDVLAGHIYVSEEVLAGDAPARAKERAAEPPRPLASLTDTELEILEHLGQGQSNQEIGRDLGMKPKAVAAAGESIRKKLKLKSEHALIRYAVCWIEGGRQ